jgi:hypothetical protein
MKTVIEMARESHMNAYGLGKNHAQFEYRLEVFAKLVRDDASFMSYQEGVEAGRLAEREACAKVCEDYDDEYDVHTKQTAKGIALQIRARRTHD